MTATARIGRPAPLVENVEWMSDTGEVLAGIARRLGISEEAVQKRVERGLLRKVGRRGRASLLAPSDGLDWAREKLGLRTSGGVA